MEAGMKATSQAYNNKTLSKFHNMTYSNYLNEDNIMGNEIAISVGEKKVAGYVLKKRTHTILFII